MISSPESLRQDVRYACRMLWSSRGYATWVIGSLSIGMAVTVAALALLNALLVLPFPAVTEQQRLVRVSMSRTCDGMDSSVALPGERAATGPDCWMRVGEAAEYDVLREGLISLQGLAAYTVGDVAAALPQARSMRGALTSANYFDVLGVRPVAGRAFQTADAQTQAAVAVIAHSVWTREFDADPSTIGRSIRVADQFVEIVGVAPPLFAGIDRDRPGGPRRISAGRGVDVWLPIWLADRVLPLAPAEKRRQARDIRFVGRLRQEVDAPQVQAEAQVLASRLAPAATGTRAEVIRLWRVNPRHWHIGVIVVMPIPVLILVIACVNAANLMLARGSQRRREIAIRLAIGAARGRIVRQLLIESAMLSVLATAVAIPIAWWGVQFASAPLNVQIPLDLTVLAATMLTAAATTIAFGLTPALRISGQQPSRTLGSVGARTDAIPTQSRARRTLVVAQVALSLGLMATAWQLVSTVRTQAVSGGTPADRVLIARFDLQPVNLAPGEMERFYRSLLDGALRLPGVEAAGLARRSSVWTFGEGAARASLVVWLPTDASEDGHVTIGGYAGGSLMEAVGLRIIAGRGFTDADRQARPRVAVVNRTFAQAMNEPAVGSIIRVAARGKNVGSSIEVRIVGVIEPTVEPRLEPDGTPLAKVYLPSPIEPEPALALYIRTQAAATLLAEPVRELVRRINPRVPLHELGSLEDVNERSYSVQLWLARAAVFLGVIGLVLATAGLYGVASYVVAMRSRELAIRMVVGAAPAVILRMVLAQSMRLAASGLLVGSGVAAVASRLIQSEYHGIQGLDAAAFGGSAAVFVAAMLLASGIPAVRASRLDPIENLRDA